MFRRIKKLVGKVRKNDTDKDEQVRLGEETQGNQRDPREEQVNELRERAEEIERRKDERTMGQAQGQREPQRQPQREPAQQPNQQSFDPQFNEQPQQQGGPQREPEPREESQLRQEVKDYASSNETVQYSDDSDLVEIKLYEPMTIGDAQFQRFSRNDERVKSLGYDYANGRTWAVLNANTEIVVVMSMSNVDMVIVNGG